MKTKLNPKPKRRVTGSIKPVLAHPAPSLDPPVANSRPCKYCRQQYSIRGVVSHENACAKKNQAATAYEELAREMEYSTSRTTEPVGDTSTRLAGAGSPPDAHFQELPPVTHMPSVSQGLDNYEPPDFGSIDIEQIEPQPDAGGFEATANQGRFASGGAYKVDDIRVEYHPKSSRPTEYFSFDEFQRKKTKVKPSPVESEPWKPFRTRVDFELADLMLDSHMNKEQSKTLLSLIRKIIEQPTDFTISGTDDLEQVWEHARNTHANGFQHRTFEVEYKNEDLQFDVSTRDIFSWIEDLADNPNIVPLFEWDARRCYKFDGTNWIRFIDEPCTADEWWDKQASFYSSQLPEGASPVFLILYADKSRLSSFGTAKGHPVFARIANLHTDIRNGDGVAGGQLVGWLPIIPEDAGETGKKGYVNFKRVVWHKSFHEILDSIRLHGQVGYLKECGDNVLRQLWPIVLILSADYEEQCVMTLIRGLGSYAPCPVCLVPWDKLTNLSSDFELRTKEKMEQVYNEAQGLNAGDKEELLKKFGLRDVENVFWELAYCDPYMATSWDGLHAHDSGLFADHLWPELKRILAGLGKGAMKQIDDQVDMVPRWRGLNHFREVVKVDFTDGGKYADIAKLVMFSTYNVLSETASRDGFALLKLLRSYLELHMYTTLSLHTSSTLAEGESALIEFEAVLQEYKDISEHEKNWEFPKAHTHKHVFQDIRRKGVTRVFSTKPNEKAHSPLKSFYQLMTNFKDFGKQILKLNEKAVVSTMIREQIAIQEHLEEEKKEGLDEDGRHFRQIVGTDHISLGSALKACTIEYLEAEHKEDLAFKDFRKRLSKKASTVFNSRIQVSAYDEITPYQTLNVSYESAVCWDIVTDKVRANPNFHSRPRYDYILVDAGFGKSVFAQLIYVFGIYVNGQTHHFALIQPFDVFIPASERPTVDKSLKYTRVRSRKRAHSAFIHVESIVRGALLIPAHDCEYGDEFLVFDQLDEDFWMRMKSIQLEHTVVL